MKCVISQFPERKFFIPHPTIADHYMDQNSDLARLLIRDNADPFKNKVMANVGFAYGKSDRTKYAAQLRISVYPFDPDLHSELVECRLLREVEKQRFPCSLEPTVFFAAFPSSLSGSVPSLNYWLMYQLIAVK